MLKPSDLINENTIYNIENKKIKKIGGLLIIAVYIATFQLLIYLMSVVGLRYGYIFNIWPAYNYQYKEYFGDTSLAGIRSIFQYMPDCSESDNILVYKPKKGACKFINPEFDTTLTFDDFGRISKRIHDGSTRNGIAVLGDSFAMGWGVNDHDTFSARLQDILARPVFNLGVSSYGTRRELRRLFKTDILTKVDTIIIQYCKNDLEENMAILSDEDYKVLAKRYEDTLYNRASKNLNVFNTLVHRLFIVFIEPWRPAISFIKSMINGTDFSKSQIDFMPHKHALLANLSEYENQLKDKKIIITYMNELNEKFYNFPDGVDREYGIIIFKYIQTDMSDYYIIDGHLNKKGHEKVAVALASMM